MTRTTARTARKTHRCDGCRSPIRAGDRYSEHVASPGHDDLNNTTWWRLRECAACCARYGRPIEGAAA